MNEPNQPSEPYRVVYSEWVRDGIRDLLRRARKHGVAEVFVTALMEIDRRLRIFPQVGDLLRDLELRPAQLRILCVPPLSVRYWLNEEARLVVVLARIVPLSGTL